MTKPSSGLPDPSRSGLPERRSAAEADSEADREAVRRLGINVTPFVRGAPRYLPETPGYEAWIPAE
jgi:hypothetical protein